MSYLDGDVWLSGPDFADWFQQVMSQRGLRAARRGEVANMCRRISEWANRDYVRVDATDKWLCFLQMHPNDIPDDLWIREPGLPTTLEGRKRLR